jgi:hypothetical protein
MPANLHPTVTHVFKRSLALTTFFLSLALLSETANATFINFDDLEYTIDEYGDGNLLEDHPVTDEYLSKGLLITGGYLWHDEYSPYISSSPNVLIGSDGFTLNFVEELPTFVSMRTNFVGENAPGLLAIFFDVYGPSGLLFQTHSSGDTGSPDMINTIPNELISFNSPTGISRITMSNYQHRRIAGAIDDLTFEYADVPEPSGLILFGMGLLIFAFRKSRIRKTPFSYIRSLLNREFAFDN